MGSNCWKATLVGQRHSSPLRRRVARTEPANCTIKTTNYRLTMKVI